MDNNHENAQLKGLLRQKCLKNEDQFWPSYKPKVSALTLDWTTFALESAKEIKTWNQRSVE